MRRLDSLRNLDSVTSSILESLPLAVAVYSIGLEVIGANTQASRILAVNDRVDESLASCAEGFSTKRWTEYLTSVLLTGQPVRLDSVPFLTDHGKRLLHVLLAPLKDGAEQTAVAGIAVFQDVTDASRLASELEIAERRAALGKLTSTVAHELNGPLDGVLRYISLALRQLDRQDAEKTRQYLQRCREGLQRMIQIVGEVLEYSRGMPIPSEARPLDQLVQEAVRTIEAKQAGNTVEIRQSYGSDVPLIRRGDLFQVFCNILKNAHDAMPNGGRLEIHGSVLEDRLLVMTFRDTGPGFPPQDMDRVFDPFFTTKEHGTGLGLPVCRDVVQRCRGQIDVQNAADGGAIVTVRLPLAEIT